MWLAEDGLYMLMPLFDVRANVAYASIDGKLVRECMGKRNCRTRGKLVDLPLSIRRLAAFESIRALMWNQVLKRG